MNNETILVGIKNENFKEKVKLLKEIISASPSAKKIFSDELDIDNIVNTPNKLELRPILSYNSNVESQEINVNNENNIVNNSNSNININNTNNENNNYNDNNVVTKPNTINKININNDNDNNNIIENELNDEDTEKVKSWLKDSNKNNLLKTSFNDKEHNTYSKLSHIYNLRKKDIDIKYIKKKIQEKVIGTLEYTVFKDYIQTLDSKSKLLLTKFMNNLSFRFKLNQEIKEMKYNSLKKTKKRNINNNLSKKNNINSPSANIIIDIVSKAPKINKDIIIFKHISIDLGESIIKEINNKKKEDIFIQDKTISVCHYNPLEELSDDTMILKILVKKNSKCLIVCPENGFLYKDSEILINPFAKLKILRKRNISISGLNKVILEAELI